MTIRTDKPVREDVNTAGLGASSAKSGKPLVTARDFLAIGQSFLAGIATGIGVWSGREARRFQRHARRQEIIRTWGEQR